MEKSTTFIRNRACFATEHNTAASNFSGKAADRGAASVGKKTGPAARTTGESDMDREKLLKFRNLLQARQQELARIVSVSQEHGRSVVEDYPQDAAERASIFASKEFFFANSTHSRRLLRMVTEALERIDEGTYGQCVACESEINSKRLEAVPWTRYCLQCQERLEQLTNQRAA